MYELIDKAKRGMLYPYELADKSKQISDIITSLIRELDEFRVLAEIGFPDNGYAESINQLSQSAIQYLRSCDTRIFNEIFHLLNNTENERITRVSD